MLSTYYLLLVSLFRYNTRTRGLRIGGEVEGGAGDHHGLGGASARPCETKVSG